MTFPSKKDRPALVLDLDGTLLDRDFRESLRLYLVPSPRTGRIFPHVREALWNLSEKADLLGVTARCFLARGNTRRWQEAQGLPLFPVLHAPVFLVRERARIFFKRRCIRRFRAAGYRPAFGVGDRGSDLECYWREGIFPLMVVPRPGGSRHKALEQRARRLGLRQGEDFLLFTEDGEAPPLWKRLEAWLEEALEEGRPPAGRGG